MSNPVIVTSIILKNSTLNLSFSKTSSKTAQETPSVVESIVLDTTSTTIDTSSISRPKSVAITNNSSAGTILVGFDGVDFDQAIEPSDMALINLRSADKVEITTVQTVADVSGSLNSTAFLVGGKSGSWAVWYDIDDSGSPAPNIGQDFSLEVSGVATDDDAAAVALATYNAMTASAEFLEDFSVAYDATTDDDLITITDLFNGVRSSAGVTSGFTVTATQEGAAPRDVYAKAESGEIDAFISIMPY